MDNTLGPAQTENNTLQRSDVPVTPYQPYQDPLEPQAPLQNSNHGSHSTATTGTAAPATRGMYRGFSTSIADSFANVENERVDCCAITCCGVLQSDRDRYILTGTKPPSCMRRVWLHVGFPIFIFMVAGYCALTIPSAYWNQVASTFLVTFLVCYMAMQCCKGQWKRIRVRKELLWRVHQMRLQANSRNNSNNNLNLLNAGDDENVPDFDNEVDDRERPSNAQRLAPRADYTNGQTQYDFKCAHAVMGCYNSDVPTIQQEKKSDNLCSCMWQCFQKSCCGKLCGCHFQLCGMCALAQEARELESLLPASRRRMDYVTMEPMMNYYPAILQLRHERNGKIVAHWKALSQLSQMLLLYSGIAIVVALVFSLLPLEAKFQFQNFLVLLGTLGQAFVLLYLVHWQWHRFDLSLDAVIKYFASGFLLSTSLAVMWELMGAALIRLVVEIIMAMFGIDATRQNEYGKQEMAFPEMGGFGYQGGANRYRRASVHDYMIELGRDHFIIYALFLIISSYIMAALIEELCKYFGYRMVDHPDFMSPRELAKAADAPVMGESDNGENGEEAAIEQRIEAHLAAANAEQGEGNAATPAVPDFSAQRRTNRSHAAAITVAMVAVAIGFACCENLVYIFVYNGASLGREIIVLINRSLLPVHPIAAAIMSVGVCRRDVEKEKVGLGRIILPAVLFHGTFDYVLLLLDFWPSIGGEDAVEDAKNKLAASLSLAFAVFWVMAGFTYYYKDSLGQRQRLAALDNDDANTNMPADMQDGKGHVID